MKKIMAIVACLTFGMFTCSAEFELVTISSGNIQNFEYLRESVSQNSDKKTLPGSEKNIKHVQTTIWDEVAVGERNLLVALENGQYAGHVFFIIQDQDIIRIGVPGCKDKSQMVSLLTLFFDDLRKLGSFGKNEVINEITFALPDDIVPGFQNLIDLFGFVKDDSVAIEGLSEKCAKYGYGQEQAENLAWFVLRRDVVLPAA